MQRLSVIIEGRKEADKHKWIESEKAGCDLGEGAIRCWVLKHWNGYLRAKWIEHLNGQNFWIELDRGDFGLLKRAFHEPQQALLLDRILDRLKCGKENLDIIQWALVWNVNLNDVVYILEILDINSRRIAYRFECEKAC